MDEKVAMSIRAQMYKELAQYVAPKKGITVGGKEGGSVPIKISWAGPYPLGCDSGGQVSLLIHLKIKNLAFKKWLPERTWPATSNPR
ncbi:MAG TPA: hypothetical protein VHJ19_13885 [Gammaproteobacteria bacterium]|nr:hypothetical protein [Gammaproteobacteria bacterium]